MPAGHWGLLIIKLCIWIHQSYCTQICLFWCTWLHLSCISNMPHNIYYEEELKSPSLIICITRAPKGINHTSRHHSANTARIQSVQNQNSEQRKGKKNCTEIKQYTQRGKHGVIPWGSSKSMSPTIKLPVHIPCEETFKRGWVRTGTAPWQAIISNQHIVSQTRGWAVEKSGQLAAVLGKSPWRQH